MTCCEGFSPHLPSFPVWNAWVTGPHSTHVWKPLFFLRLPLSDIRHHEKPTSGNIEILRSTTGVCKGVGCPPLDLSILWQYLDFTFSQGWIRHNQKLWKKNEILTLCQKKNYVGYISKISQDSHFGSRSLFYRGGRIVCIIIYSSLWKIHSTNLVSLKHYTLIITWS